MVKNYSNGSSIRATLKEMAIGDTVRFPVAKTSVIRSTYSTLGLELERKYTAKLSRPNKTIDVTRLS